MIELNKLAEISEWDCAPQRTVTSIVKTILNFIALFKENYNKKRAAARILDIVINMIGSEFFPGMSAEAYFR